MTRKARKKYNYAVCTDRDCDYDFNTFMEARREARSWGTHDDPAEVFKARGTKLVGGINARPIYTYPEDDEEDEED